MDAYNSKEKEDLSLDIDLGLDDMKRRKLKGFLGEEIIRICRKRILEQVTSALGGSWEVRDDLHLVNKDSPSQRYRASGRPERGEIRIEGNTVKHSGKKEKKLREHVHKNVLKAPEDLFERFRELRNPFIDFSFYAVRSGSGSDTSFEVRDYSGESFAPSRLKLQIPEIEDFKILFLEAKTTEDDAKNLLSSNQRSVRDQARNSPYTQFFTARIGHELRDGVPESVRVSIEEHS